MSRNTYEKNSNNSAKDCWATEVPDEIGIDDCVGSSGVDNVSKTSVEEIKRGHETSHVNRSTRVRNAVRYHKIVSSFIVLRFYAVTFGHTGNVDEQLGEATQGIRNGLPPERDVRDETVVNTVGVRRAELSARRQLVGLPTDKGVSDTTEGTNEETRRNARNRAVVNLELAQEWVDTILEGVQLARLVGDSCPLKGDNSGGGCLRLEWVREG